MKNNEFNITEEEYTYFINKEIEANEKLLKMAQEKYSHSSSNNLFIAEYDLEQVKEIKSILKQLKK